MDKTKFWFVDGFLFTSKIEAEYHAKRAEEECYCHNMDSFACFSHRCCSGVKEVDLATVIKDKKYRKFLDEKLIQLFEEKKVKISETVKIENDIEEIKIEQENLK